MGRRQPDGSRNISLIPVRDKNVLSLSKRANRLRGLLFVGYRELFCVGEAVVTTRCR
jgi:hypothetical protein